MSKNIQRVAKLETGLTPKQAILLWFQEAHGFNTIFEYIHHLKSQPDSAAPIPRLTDQVAEAVKQTLKGHPREEIDKAVRQAYKDVLFLFFLHQQVSRKLISEERYFWTQGRFLIAELKSLLREQALGRRMRWNEIRVGIETPYPLDSETAAAVEAAKQHYVMTWELLEEGDDLGQWLLESFLAKGNTALPDGAYGMMSGAKHLYSKVPTEDEVRPLFEDAESFQKFLDGEDYSYGLADVPDAEYDEHYEALVSAIKGVAKQGIVVDMPSVPHQFLQEAPLVNGEWIDGYIVELAEWGARLVEKGLLLEESGDYHPMAWKRIINQEHGSEACAAVSMKLWQQTRKRLAAFPGSTRVIDERQYLNFADYLKWRGRRNKGDLKSGMRRGLVVSSWNQWVESQGGEGVATLAGVASGILDCYLDGYRYRVCRNAGELAEEVSRRESLLESVQVGKPDSSNDERFRQRVEHWKISALGFLPEIYILSRAINSISQRYFEGQDPLFSEVSDGFGQLLALVEKLVNIYNEALEGDIERSERLLTDISQRAAGADQPLHLQVQILVLRLSHRDPGVTVERHLPTPLARIPEVWLSARGFATGFASHPFSYGEWGFTAMAVNRAVSSHLPWLIVNQSRFEPSGSTLARRKLWGYWARMRRCGSMASMRTFATQTVVLSTMCSRRTGAGHERRIGCA